VEVEAVLLVVEVELEAIEKALEPQQDHIQFHL
jgi:hypothetical protein